jgi:trimethylguanosine synthase
LFSRFDQGIKLDKESWFSVTPEAIADHIAARLVGLDENLTIIDPFCGVCGNAIAFAKRDEVKLVVCVDVDLEKLKKAAWNARVYDIPNDKIVFIHSDAYTILSQYNNGSLLPSPSRENDPESSPLIEKGYRIGQHELLPNKIDMVFLSPPWGGMDYLKVGKRNYDLKCIELDHAENKIDGEELLIVAAKAVGEGRPIAYFLPRNTNGIKLARSVLKAGCTGPVVMEQNVLNGKLKTITAYVGL